MRKSDYENELSVEQIRNRMIKNAARIWNVETDEIESSFDPLVSMLIEACSYELNKINREMLSSRKRIMNRLAQTLSPETLTGTQPAHTIIHARSTEPYAVIDKDAQFSCSVKQFSADVDKKEITKEVYFSPTGKYKIFDASVKYVASTNKVVEYKNAISRTSIIDEPSGNMLHQHTLWLGLEINSKIQQLDDFVFYFDWKNDPDEYKYLKLLPLTKWFIGPYKLELEQGIHQGYSGDYVVAETTLANQYDVSNRHEHIVNQFYDKSFYTLRSGDSSKINLQEFLRPYPSELAESLSPASLTKMQGKFLWIKLMFNTAIPTSALQDVFISINCWPALNRKINKVTYQLKNNLSIVPLPDEDYFLDMISLMSNDGNRYRSNPLSSGFSNDVGYYTLRYGGMERFDQRQATELLSNVLDRLRDESAAFNSLGNDFINNQIKAINQAIALIESRLDVKGAKSSPSHFLLVRALKKDDTVFAKYLSTNGPVANGIKAGTKLLLQSSGDLRSDSLTTVVITSGGKYALSENEKIVAFKKALLTHDRILTEQDIYVFCEFELGSLADRIEIRKNWKVLPGRQEGITRIIQIIITPGRNQEYTPAEWRTMALSLENKILQQSNHLMPIQVLFVVAETKSS